MGQELQNRRQFFKGLAKKVLPILGATLLANSALAKSVMNTPSSCSWCSGTCTGTCDTTCAGTCQYSCQGSCSGYCKYTCTHTCSQSCLTGCYGYSN